MLTLSVLTSFTHARVFLIKSEYFYERFLDFLFFFGFHGIALGAGCPIASPAHMRWVVTWDLVLYRYVFDTLAIHASGLRVIFPSSYFHIQSRIFSFFHIEIPIFFVKRFFLSQYSPFLEPNLGSFFMVRSADAIWIFVFSFVQFFFGLVFWSLILSSNLSRLI